MSSGFALLLAFGIGIVAGLRSMTAPAVVAWAAHIGWISLSGSSLAFMGSVWAVAVFTLGALGEFVADQLPIAPARTTAVPLIARIVIGLLTGACLGVAGSASLWLGALIGAARRNCRSVRRLSGSGRTRSRPARSGFCDRRPGRPGCRWAWAAAGFQILNLAN